ncbi:hypothetical protein ACLMJK_001456 [Lecanora helva]
MPTRLPLPTDFPSSPKLDIIPPPTSSPQLSNVLILLHGLGDTSTSFTNLARQLSLPETICLSIQAPTPLPFELGGFHFGDDIQFDPTTGQMEFDTGFSKISQVLRVGVIQEALIQKCGFKPREILFLGFGQGAMGALAAAASISTDEFGGIISIGGPLPSSATSARNVKTPVLLLGGSSNTLITRSAVEKVKQTFKNVEYQKWNRAGDGMPRSRDEMLPIMRFFARRLRSRRGVPEGSIEVG